MRTWAALLGLRWAAWAAAALPALLAGVAGSATGPARSPYFTDHYGLLPFVPMLRLARALSVPALVGVVAAVLITLVLHPWVTAGSAGVLLHHGTDGARGAFARGAAYLGASVRVALWALLASAAGLVALHLVFRWVERRGGPAGWTAETLLIVLPALRVLLGVTWMATVGAGALWCRVLTVADGRTRTRRTALLVLTAWRIHPLRGPVAYVLATLGLVALGGAALLAWRQGLPGGAALFALVTGVQAAGWTLLLRRCAELVAGASLAAVRARPDAPWGVRDVLRRWCGRANR